MPDVHRRLATVAAVVIGLVAAASVAPAAADPASWTPEPVAAPSIPSGVLTAVSCPTSTLCLAVGTVSSPAGTTTSFAQKWDGTTWKRVSASAPAGAVSARLDGVSCVSATSCLAVGSWRADATTANTRPFAARWNGVAFVASSVPPAAGFPSSQLSGVSCLANTVVCVAVGSASKPTATQPFAVVYRGGNRWQALPDPPSGTTYPASLSAVSCVRGTAQDVTCFAAGIAHGAALVDRFDGSSWTLQTTPTGFNGLSGVSCPTTTSCLAVSDPFDTQPTNAMLYNGTRWKAVPTPPPANNYDVDRLRSVSCVSPTDCTAVGDTLHPPARGHPTTFTVATSLLEHWDGTAWTERALPQQTPVSNNVLSGVACTAAGCTAVGRFGTANYSSYDSDANEIEARPLAFTGSGTTWQLQDVTGAKSSRTSRFTGISCPTATFCAVVGDQGPFTDPVGAYRGDFQGAASSGLLEMWDGTTWSLPAVPANVGTLTDVSCASATACLATGSSPPSAAGAVSAVTVRWDGTSWTAATPPPVIGVVVSCDAPASCTVANGAATDSYHWDGTTWTPTATPTAGVTINGLSCTSAATCVAVGSYDGGHGVRPLVFLLSASGWRWIRDVAGSTGRVALNAVSCTAANACTAVGQTITTGSNSTAFITTFDGHTWSQSAAPALGDRTTLYDVSCTATDACHAAGVTGTPAASDPLVEAWDGTAWTQVPASRPAGLLGKAPLRAVSCVAARCFAAGIVSVPDGGFRPYVLSGTA